MLRWLTGLSLLTLVLFIQGADRQVLANHDGHTIAHYFVSQFTENPPVAVPVYDCAGQGHTHPSIIAEAVAMWNATGRVHFSYQPGATTPCDSEGFPLVDDAVTVFHNQCVRTADFNRRQHLDSWRQNDVGTEGDIGMFPVRQARIRIRVAGSWPASCGQEPPNFNPNTDTHTSSAIAHELGHAAGLSDLYVEGTACVEGHKHNPVTITIMSCGTTWPPGSHDIANLDLLYKKQPTQVNDFAVVDTYQSGGKANVVFEWTDRSYNEKFQAIGRVGYPFPILAPRDAETFEWQGLELDTVYCFWVQPVNGYDIAAPPSAQDCVLTPPDLNGLYDIVVPFVDAGLFHCIMRLDHDVITDVIATRQQCNNDIPGLGETGDMPPHWADVSCIEPDCPNPDLQVPGEPGPDLIPGPPPPPPYTSKAPSVGAGTYFPTGDFGDTCAARLGHIGQTVGEPCLIYTVCFEDVGSPSGIGPNVIARIYIGDPADRGEGGQAGNDGKVHGVIDFRFNQNNTSCANLQGTGPVDLFAYPFTAHLAHDAGFSPGTGIAPWRNTSCGAPPCNPNPGWTVLDYDGDGCRDWDELAPSPPASCGDDPYNPSDSFNPSTVDLMGAYDVNIRVTRGDVGAPGEYFSCRSYLEHDTGSNILEMPIYCYHDKPGVEINPEAYPGVTGDGFFGAPPPGPCPAPDPSCTDDFADYAYGDVHAVHSALSGSYNPASRMISLTGCLEDRDGHSPVGDIWLDMDVSAHQLPGTVVVYTNAGDGDHLDGTFCESPSGGTASILSIVKQPGGAARDADQDGVGIKAELSDDPLCGQRDPFNKNDYYDVSIPRDGIIDLLGDILSVQNNFEPVGYAAGAPALYGPGTMENYDRPLPMTGGASGWSRGAPDGKIDLLVDILAVQGQFNPVGCTS